MGGWPGRGRGHAGRDRAANGAHGLLAWISHTSGIATTGLFAGSLQLQAPHRPWHLYPPAPPPDGRRRVRRVWLRDVHSHATPGSSPAAHGHTSQIIDPQTASDHSPGAIATLITADGQPMVVNYATNLDGAAQPSPPFGGRTRVVIEFRIDRPVPSRDRGGEPPHGGSGHGCAYSRCSSPIGMRGRVRRICASHGERVHGSCSDPREKRGRPNGRKEVT